MSRRTFLKVLGAAAAGALVAPSVAATYDFVVERPLFRVSRLESPVTVAWLSDIHYGPFIRAGSIAAWFDAALSEAPDVIVLGGDQADRMAPRDTTPLLEQVARLRAPLGVYAVRGNHDHSRFGEALDAFEIELAAAGVETLVNRGIVLRDDCYLAGIDDFSRGEPDVTRALAHWPEGMPCLLASHNPDVLPEVPPAVDLTVCGHTHGGQVVLPLIGPIATSSEYGRRFLEGRVEAPARGYVGRGLGVAHLPVRVNCPPELTLLTLIPG
jgi:uncharacterized protein